MSESDMDVSLHGCEELATVPEYLVERIADQQWVGVNGTYDNDSEWRGWEELTAAFNPYSNLVIHILPYVNINW